MARRDAAARVPPPQPLVPPRGDGWPQASAAELVEVVVAALSSAVCCELGGRSVSAPSHSTTRSTLPMAMVRPASDGHVSAKGFALISSNTSQSMQRSDTDNTP